MDVDSARTALLDRAEELFYARGVQAVGMDELRAAAGVSLKRLYQLFPAKQDLVEAYLERRDPRWRAALLAHATAVADPRERLLRVFDWLGEWFATPGFRGCAWVNSYGELGAQWPRVAALARAHKAAFRADLAALVDAAGLRAELTGQLALLAEGAIVTAALAPGTEPAATARAAAATLLGG
jgi:AcrR family transcriptional regulator